MDGREGKKGGAVPLRPGAYDAQREAGDNAVGRRLAEGRRRLGLSQAAFAEALGALGVRISLRGYAKWETGESVPGAYQLLAAARLLGEDSLSFFTQRGSELSPEGLRRLRDYREDLIASGRYRPAAPKGETQPWLREVLVSRLRPSAGPGNYLEEENFEKSLFPADAVPPGADFAVRVEGCSMEPVYGDGQLVWVQRCDSLRSGEVGLLCYGGSSYIKVYGEREPPAELRAYFTDSEGCVYPQPVLISYNREAYPPVPVHPEKGFAIVGRIL